MIREKTANLSFVQFFHALDSPQTVQSVPGFSEQDLTHDPHPDPENVFVLSLDGRQLRDAFSFQFRLRESRAQDQIRKNFQPQRQILSQDLHANPETVARTITVQVPSNRLDSTGQSGSVPIAGAFDQRIRHQLCQTAGFFGLCQYAPPKNGSYFNERQPVVLFDQ